MDIYFEGSVPYLDHQQFLLATWKMSMPVLTFWWACGMSPAIVDDAFYFLMTLQIEKGSNCAEQLNDVVL